MFTILQRSPTSTHPDQQRSPSSINPKQPSPSDSIKDDLVNNIPGGSSSPSKDISPSSEEVHRIRNSCVYQNHDPRDSGSDGSGGSHYTNRGKGA
ncbi:unnamed protein product, partial [Timema podura]|nr:unnamed protein product [Timema podura]